MEINEKTADIQARLFMARTLGENGKERQTDGEPKSGHMKNLISITDENYEEFIFIDAEDKEFKETIKNARKKIGNITNGLPAMPCKILKNQ